MQDPTERDAPAAVQTVEEVVRIQLAKALGGRRGMVEAAVPTILFTVLFLTTKELQLALVVSVGCALVLLGIRLAQRSSTQFVLNSLFGIGIGAFFAYRSAQGGGDVNDQALAYFLPGILYNAVYSVVILISVAVRWPVVGFLVGSVTGDPTAWRANPGIVRLCSRLTWILAVPCVIRVIVQTPIYLAGRNKWWDQDGAIAALAATKIGMGWPLQIAALAAMVWILNRDRTPMVDEPATGARQG